MTNFDADTLRELRDVQEVAIRTEKHPKSAVVIWVVVADDEVFVRSWRGAKGLGPMAAHITLPGSIGCFQTSSAGAWASTTDCGKPTSSTTLMSSCSGSIGVGHGMPRSLHCSVSAPAPPQLPTTC